MPMREAITTGFAACASFFVISLARVGLRAGLGALFVLKRARTLAASESEARRSLLKDPAGVPCALASSWCWWCLALASQL